jgi:PKD repeat protein
MGFFLLRIQIMRCRRNAFMDMLVSKKRLLLLTGCFFLYFSSAQAQDYNTWSGHMQITINTSSLGLSGNLFNFPLLIRLNSSNFPYFSQTLSNGDDIRFSKANYDTHLSFEIERWDATGGNAEIWVKVDTILQSSATQSIIMHWGKSGVSSESSAAGVFAPSPSNGFISAYHFNYNVNSATGNYHGNTDNSVDTAAGIIGRARAFNGSSQFFQTGDLPDRSSGAITCWFRPKATFNSSSTTQGIYGKKTDDNTDATLSLRGTDFTGGNGSTGCIVTKFETNPNASYNSTSTTSWTAGTWYHIVWSWTSATDSLYVNGVLQNGTTHSASLTGSASDEIGRSYYDGSNVSGGGPKYFNGTLDEFRIENYPRSANWNILTYETQRPDQAVLTYTLPDNENYTTNWPYHADIVINTSNTGGGANLPSGTNVYNFPLSIRLNPVNFPSFGQTLPGGADIRFAKSDGTHLPYEIERWVDHSTNTSLDTAEIWVKLDTVFPQNSTQYVRMYWGNPTATNRSNPSTVFTTAYYYTGVWHMNETPGAAGSIKDRSGNAYNGTPAGGMSASSSVYGVVGKALEFDGTDDHISLPSISTNFTGGITVSAWMNYHTYKSWSRLIDWSENGSSNDNIVVGNSFSTDSVDWELWNGTAYTTFTSPSYFTANTWVYVTVSYNGSSMYIYKNGSQVATKSISNALANVTRTTNYIARNNWSGYGYFDGYIDELQVSSVARYPSTIKLAYETQKPGATCLCYPATITQNPRDTFVNLGTAATFRVTVAGSASTYQWERSADGGSSWATAPGTATNSTYTITATAVANDSNRFRCVVSSCNSSVTSTAAVLTVCIPPVISDPANATVTVGDAASFSVTGLQGKNLSYQWQRSNGGGAWTNISSGGTAATYTLVTDTADTNARFRCLGTAASTACGTRRDTSTAATLSLCFSIVINTQPASQSITAGELASFTAAVGGKNLAYQWQRRNFGSSGWGTISGANAATYSFTTAIPNVDSSRAPDSGAQFWCIIASSCGSDTTNVALLSVCAPPVIRTQPRDTNATIGTVAIFRINAKGSNPTYQWQRSDNGGTSWTNVTAGTGGTSATYSFTTAASDTGAQVQFRCVVTACGMSVNSTIARIGVCFPPQITDQPDTLDATNGQQASFTVAASGSGLSYYWQKRNRGGSTWDSIKTPSPATSATYSLTAVQADSGALFRCLIGGSCGSATSTAALLRVCTPISIDTARGPRDTSVTGGDTARFSITVSGTAPTYQWWRSRDNGSSWLSMNGATAASLKFKTDTVDTQTLYRCVVGGQCGNVTTRAARLTLCFPITIRQHPSDAINVAPDQQVTFRVSAGGLPISYQWGKSTNGGSSWDTISGATSNNYTLTVKAGDDGSKYRCRVYNGCSSLYSTAATVTVCIPPSITAQPSNQTVIEGQTARFRISAGGTNHFCQWIKKAGGGVAWDTISGAIDTFYNLLTKTSDHGSEFRCVVRGTCGACTSSVAALMVYQKVKAGLLISDTLGPAPLEIELTDASSGAISRWKWSYGDGDVDSADTAGIITHTYDSVKVYTVTLTVSGPGGVDSMKKTVTVYSSEGNPIVMTGRYLSPTSIELVLKNYGSLRSDIPPPFVTEVKLWNRVNTLPVDTISAKKSKSFTLSQLKARGSEYRDTVAVTALAPPDSLYGFMTQIVWNDHQTTPFAALNGCRVLMRDTLRPANPVVLSGRYAPWDTVFFKLDSVKKIDTAKADSVALWFGLGSDSVPNFSTRTNVVWWSARSVVQGASGSAFTYVLKNDQFNTDRKILYTAVIIQGKNKQRSVTKTASFTIGRVRPTNSIILHALALDPNSIRLSWNKQRPDSVEKVRIYFKTGGEFGDEYDFSNVTAKDSIAPAPAVSDTADTVYHLKEKTRYYFAAQIYRQGMWSRAVRESKATDSTGEADSSTITNKVTITKLGFDTTTNCVKVRWTVDTAVGSNLQIGISYSLKKISPKDSTIKQVVEVKSKSDSALLDLGSDLLFDTTFTIYLWLKKAGEKWTLPTGASTDSVRIPPFVWQLVRYSVKLMQNDTTRWVNGRIRFATNMVFSRNDEQNYVGKIHRFDGDSASMRGFVVVGQSFVFTEKQSSMPLEVGLKCYALPSKYSLKDVRMYRWNGTCWILDRSAAFDTANAMVAVRTSDLDEPFAAMIDIEHPKVKVLNKMKDSLEVGREIADTILVSDNVGNVTWKFKCVQGDQALSASDTSQQKVLLRGRDTARVVIARTLVNEENGVRAALIADDGRFSDTVALSRRVIRAHSDVTPISRELSWIPLRVTAELDTPNARRLWRVVDTTISNPKYDNRHIRLFRWYHDRSNTASDSKWLEYGTDRDSIFEFRAGRLFWVKLLNTARFDFGRALTMPLNDTVVIPLNGKGWTDFALPYRFDVRIGDIIAATRALYDAVDSLQFYRWDTTGSTYKCSPFYLLDLKDEGYDNGSMVVSARDFAGYTVYNPLSKAISLRIPPTPLAMSSIVVKNKTVRGNGFSVRIDARASDGSTLPEVYCSYSPERKTGEKYLPVPPSFQEARVGVYNERLGGVCGHKITGSLQDGGCAFLLAFGNDGTAAQDIYFNLDRCGQFPEHFKTALYNQLTGETKEIADVEQTLTVAAGSEEYRWLLIGDAGYITAAAKLRGIGVLSLMKPYPNPVRGFVHLRYTLPFASVSRVDFSIVDIRGRVVWQKTIKEKSVMGGGRECIWNGTTSFGQRLASGLYVIKMTAYNLKHKRLGSFDERITVIR